MIRVGQGWDVHPLEAGRPLWIGGVRVAADRGAVGDSDGDVLLHAAMDALLGAAGRGDLGTVHPRSQVPPGTRSTALWTPVWERVRQDGWQVASFDATVVLEAPRLGPYRTAMESVLRDLLETAHASVKFKTADGLGAVGAGQAVMASAVVLLER